MGEVYRARDSRLGREVAIKILPESFAQDAERLRRTGKRTILVDTCTGEDKGYPPPMDFPKAPWLDGFRAAGLRFEDIDYVFCTHLHIDHCGWNTLLRDGRWVPTFPNAKYVFHKREYAAWEEATKRGAQPSWNWEARRW